MRFKLCFKRKIFSQAVEQPEALEIIPAAQDVQISKAFLVGSGRSNTETKRAFKAISLLVLPYWSPKRDYHTVLKSLLGTPPFETKIVDRKKVTCFIFNNICYEIPQNKSDFKISLIEESGIFNQSWGEGNSFTEKDIRNFDKFLSENKIVSVADYDNFLKQRIFVTIENKLYFLYPRIAVGGSLPLKEILKSKLSLKSTTQIYGGEIVTKQVLEQYLSENDFTEYYNIIDSTDHTFARIENFVVSEKGQEVLDQYSRINFAELKSIISKNYFFNDHNLELLVYISWMSNTPYYNPIKSIQKEPVRRTQVVRNISELYETYPDKAINSFREGLNKLVQDLVFISEMKKGDLEKYYYLLDAMMSIKFFYYRDIDRQISDKINLESMKETTFDTSLMDKKADFLLMPTRKFHQILPVILVEFDGEQHFKPKFGRNFVRIKFYDAIKNNFFSNTPGFGIIRVPFTLVKDSPTKDYKPDVMAYIKPELDKLIKTKLSELQVAARSVFNFKKFSSICKK